MSVNGRIINARGTLAKAEGKVADYILAHANQMTTMTVAELAQAAGASPAAVIRLTKRLEIDGFTALKLMLSADVAEHRLAPKTYADITPKEPISTIKEKLLAGALDSLRETTDQINDHTLAELIRLIADAHQLNLFGIGASNLAAENISQKWNRLGYLTVADNDLNSLLPKLVNAQPNDVLWLVSNSGTSPEVLVAAKFAKDHGIKVISLTRFGDNALARLSDLAVHTSQPKESANRIAATNSLLAQFMVIDIIFYTFVSQHFEASATALENSRQIIHAYKQKLH